MELTKKDQKQIEEETRSLMLKITAEATEYAHLYETAFYTRLIEKLQCKIEAAEYLHNYAKQNE